MIGNRRPCWLAAVIVLATTAAGAVGAEAGRDQGEQRPSPLVLRPVDEAGEDATLVAQRQRLLAALRSRSLGDVLALSADSGAQAVRGHLSASGGDHWNELIEIMELGGSFTTERGKVKGRREFCAPYTYSEYPMPPPLPLQDLVDPWVVIGADVKVRERPDASATATASVSFEFVFYLVAPVGAQAPYWANVRLQDGRRGYVSMREVRSPVDYHACLAQVDGRWVLSEYARTTIPW